jgi:hypothetical protein
VVDPEIRPPFLCAPELLLVSRRDADGEPDTLRDLERGEGHAPPDSDDEERLARPGLPLGDEHPPGGEEGQGKGGGFLPGEPLRLRIRIDLGSDDVFGESPPDMLAEQVEGHAEGMFPPEAELARSAVDSGIQDNLVSRFHARHPRAREIDDARAVRSHHVRHGKRDSRDSVADEDVEVVERPRAQADPHLTRPGNGVGKVVVPDLVYVPVPGEKGSLHGGGPSPSRSVRDRKLMARSCCGA